MAYEVAGILAQTQVKTGSLFMFLWPVTIFFLLLLAVVDTWYDLLLKNPQAERAKAESLSQSALVVVLATLSLDQSVRS